MRCRLCVAAAASLLVLTATVAAQDAPATVANGVFLVAKRSLVDPNFERTVVLVTLPPDGGAIGVIVNRPLGRKLSELIPDSELVPSQSDELFSGGPVARTQVLMLVRTPVAPAHALRVLDDVYLSGDPALLKDIKAGKLPGARVRFYAGYAGWARGQLQAEVARDGWHLVPATADAIFSDDARSLWPDLIRKLEPRDDAAMWATP